MKAAWRRVMRFNLGRETENLETWKADSLTTRPALQRPRISEFQVLAPPRLLAEGMAE